MHAVHVACSKTDAGHGLLERRQRVADSWLPCQRQVLTPHTMSRWSALAGLWVVVVGGVFPPGQRVLHPQRL